MGNKPRSPTVEGDDQSHSNYGRKATKCSDIVATRAKGKKTPIVFDEDGEPTNEKAHTKWISFIGLMARSKVNIAQFQSWPQVDENIKDMIWNEVMNTFEFQSTPELKNKWLVTAGERWRNWKTTLTTHYIFGNKKDEDPCATYLYLSRDTWETFRNMRLSEEWQAKRVCSQESSNKNKLHHIMSRGGYSNLQRRMMNDKYEAKIQRNVESGKTDEEARRTTSPPSPILRHILFKECHKNKHGDFSSNEARDISLTIDQLTTPESQGESVGDGRKDILVIATGKDDHPGRIRGVGGRMRMSQVF